ncbi:N-6 DNA methylase [Pseudoalteromonas sp. R86517]|uniref:N-6 DNA methylase n=1 Tax=Pseudoalteromonas sp. R86517 TaxID=3093857 RepID=UPI00366E77D8
MQTHNEINSLAIRQAKEIWRLLEYIRGSAPIASYRSLAYMVLFIRYMQDNSGQHFNVPRFYSFDAIGQYIDELVLTCIELGLFQRELGYIASEFTIDILRKNNRIEEDLVKLLAQSNGVNRDKYIVKQTLDELNKLFAANEMRSGSEFYTPKDINKLVTTLGMQYSPKSVCDPFAGAGSTAFSFYEATNGKVQIDTQEVSTDIYFQLVITRILKGIDGTDFLEDSISHPKYKSELYDLIVSFPPFGLKIPTSTKEAIYKDSSNEWLALTEELPVTRSDWLATLSMFPSLGSKTKLVIGMSLSSLTRVGSEARIREFLIDKNVVDTIILLPKAIHYSTNIPTVLLIFDMAPQKNTKSVRFVDASLFYEPHRGRNLLSDENITKIFEATISDGRFSKRVAREKLARNNFNLNPSLYVDKTIKVSKVKLTNYRGYKDFTVPLHESLTVLVGENGAGKTSILEAVACGLGPFLTAMPEAKGRLIRKSDIHVGIDGVADFSRISIDTNSSLSWDLVTRGTEKSTQAKIGTQALSDFANQIVNTDTEYPLIAYYGTNRTLSNSSNKVSISPFEELQRSEGYDSALEAKINYGSLKNWFTKIEVDELKLRDKKKNHDIIHPAKVLVARAVKEIVNRVQNVTFDKSINDVVVTWENESGESISLGLEQLSEGYRNMVALTIDLVRRAYLLNPNSKAPLSVVGVVLIDEIELHLHPRWQQDVLEDITKLFPNIQFVVTTHSPQVLTTVRGESIRVVSNSLSFAETVNSPFGGENSRVMKQILHVNSRPVTDVSRKLKEYFDLIELGKGEDREALVLREELTKLTDGTEPMLVEADLAIKRVNWMKSRKSQ